MRIDIKPDRMPPRRPMPRGSLLTPGASCVLIALYILSLLAGITAFVCSFFYPIPIRSCLIMTGLACCLPMLCYIVYNMWRSSKFSTYTTVCTTIVPYLMLWLVAIGVHTSSPGIILLAAIVLVSSFISGVNSFGKDNC